MKSNVRPQSKTAGFSLIEILVTIALLSILSGIGISLYAIVNNSYSRAKSISDIQAQGSSVMEQIERSVRSSVAVSDDLSNCASGADSCLTVTVPPDSLDYQTNGNCDLVIYRHEKPTANTNGKLSRALQHKDGTSCGSTIDLFDTDSQKGISVEQIGTQPVLDMEPAVTGQDRVIITMDLMQGVALGGANRSHVPFITTISLRDYSN